MKKQDNPIQGTILEQKLENLPATYPELAMRTNKPGKDIDITLKWWQALSTGYPSIMEGCYKADRLKASMVYGAKLKDFGFDAFPMPKRPMKDSDIEVLHAILGIISEGGELLQMFYERINAGKPLDRANLREEGGDALWFLQLLCHAGKMPMEELMHMNILKLHKRFGDKYSDVSGLVRDHVSERKLLENITEEQDKKGK